MQIRTAAKGESITQQTSIRKQEEILSSIANILDNIGREYESLERGQQVWQIHYQLSRLYASYLQV